MERCKNAKISKCNYCSGNNAASASIEHIAPPRDDVYVGGFRVRGVDGFPETMFNSYSFFEGLEDGKTIKSGYAKKPTGEEWQEFRFAPIKSSSFELSMKTNYASSRPVSYTHLTLPTKA